MKTDGMKVINDYIKPELDRHVASNIEGLKQDNVALIKKLDDLHLKIYDLDAERTKLSENQINELENNYLARLKDARL